MLMLFTITSCRQESAVVSDTAITQNRTPIAIVFRNLRTEGCCVIVEVRTNESVNSFYPIHIINVSGQSGLIDKVYHGGQYGSEWHSDNDPDFPNYWVMTYCFRENGSYAISPELVGIAPPVFGTPPPPLTFDITDCNENGKCSYWICNTDYYGAFGCSESVTVEINGVQYDSPLTGGPITNAVPGIAQMRAAMRAIADNFGITYAEYANLVPNCSKRGNVNFSHIYLNTDIKFIKLNGSSNCQFPQSPNAGLKDVKFNITCQ
jgi:hypothetical protein